MTDLHFIIGPSRDHISHPVHDFPDIDIEKLNYDEVDPATNILQMFEYIRQRSGDNVDKRNNMRMLKMYRK